MKALKLLFAFCLCCVYLIAQTEAAPTTETATPTPTSNSTTSNSTTTSNEDLMDEIVDLRQNLTNVWKTMAVLSDRLERLEQTDNVDVNGGADTDSGSWHCDDDQDTGVVSGSPHGGGISSHHETTFQTFPTNMDNFTNPLTAFIERITGERRHPSVSTDSGSASGRTEPPLRRTSQDHNNKESDGGEDEDENEDEDEDKDEDANSGENQVKAGSARPNNHRRQSVGGRKCSWRPSDNRRSKMNNNQEERRQNITAICNVRPNKALPPERRPDVRGRINLVQKGSNKLVMIVKVTGLPVPSKQPSDATAVKQGGGRRHGFHAHEFGNLTNGCESAGKHYNPLNFNHSGPTSPKRHLGDFGNLVSDERGIVDTVLEIDIEQPLSGKHSLIGKAFVIHELEDDLGASSSPTGNTGARLACCVVTSQ